jgi:hypothetical protein
MVSCWPKAVISVVARLEKGTELSELVHLGAMDMIVLSGKMTYPEGPMAGTLEPGTWLGSEDLAP